jgi:hypothetical protein
VFQTTDKAQVEEHCRRNGIETEWKEGDRTADALSDPRCGRCEGWRRSTISPGEYLREPNAVAIAEERRKVSVVWSSECRLSVDVSTIVDVLRS